MHAPVNPFQAKQTSSHRIETGAFWAFRIATYIILLAAACIFLRIVWKGLPVVLQATPPFINTEFFTAAPETLYVFEYEGKKMEMGDREFRAFKQERAIDDIPASSYGYSAGGIFPAIVGTVLLVVGSMTIALFLGVCAAIYLSEYSSQGRLVHWIRLAVVNLAGVPSIVFGLFGVGLFVLFMPIIGDYPNPAALHFAIPFTGKFVNFTGWGVCLLSGWFTLAFMVLPVVIAASEESLRAVPQGFREGSLALGATRWQSIRTNVLPYALPGILTSSILGIARVAGETAPIMFTAAYVVRDDMPWENLARWSDFFFQGVMALPYHIYVVSSKIPQNEYTERVQYGTAFVFLLIVSLIALASVLLRIKMRNRYRW